MSKPHLSPRVKNALYHLVGLLLELRGDELAHVLYIESSPRKLRSASIEVAQAALSAWRKADPKLTVDTLDVWSTKLPEFDGPLMEAKYAGLAGTPLTKEQDSAWSALREIAE